MWRSWIARAESFSLIVATVLHLLPWRRGRGGLRQIDPGLLRAETTLNRASRFSLRRISAVQRPTQGEILEPVSGFEPLTCRLQVVRPRAPCVLAAMMARLIALTALAALGLSGDPVHEPVHARGPAPRHPTTVRNVTLGTAFTPASPRHRRRASARQHKRRPAARPLPAWPSLQLQPRLGSAVVVTVSVSRLAVAASVSVSSRICRRSSAPVIRAIITGRSVLACNPLRRCIRTHERTRPSWGRRCGLQRRRRNRGTKLSGASNRS